MNIISHALALTLLATGPGAAPTSGTPTWIDHAAPFSFRFDNEIDMHQQTRVTADGGLFGFLYIAFTGTVTKDGERVATHVDCSTAPGCTLGWVINGTPVGAEMRYQEMPDHPVVLVDCADIPQPGAYSHWHCKGAMPMPGTSSNGYLLQLFATDKFCFIHHDAAAAQSSKTCRENGGLKVRPGIDAASHLNIVTSFPSALAP